jgi:hypothetical protein
MERVKTNENNPELYAISPSSSATTVDFTLECRTIPNIDMALIALFGGLYMLSLLDRSNMGNANLTPMTTDLHLSTPRDDLWDVLSTFYISYVCSGLVDHADAKIDAEIAVGGLLYGCSLVQRWVRASHRRSTIALPRTNRFLLDANDASFYALTTFVPNIIAGLGFTSLIGS